MNIKLTLLFLCVTPTLTSPMDSNFKKVTFNDTVIEYTTPFCESELDDRRQLSKYIVENKIAHCRTYHFDEQGLSIIDVQERLQSAKTKNAETLRRFNSEYLLRQKDEIDRQSRLEKEQNQERKNLILESSAAIAAIGVLSIPIGCAIA